MKKNLFFVLTLFLSVNTIIAQMPNGSIGPDFTEMDINGDTISLYTDFLDQGKPVIMDISATWCGPCWNFHNTHTLKDIYMNYGNAGSEEIGVLFVEGDGSTGMAELQGTGGSTQGDWITGTPYPIIDNDGIANNYQIAYYPTIYGVCPDRTVYELGQISSSNMIQALITNCSSITSFNGSLDNAGINSGADEICSGDDVIPTATIHNYGTNTITSATIELFELGNTIAIETQNWTGNLTPGSDATIQFSTISSVTNTSNYQFTVSNPNGNTDNYPLYNSASYDVIIVPSTTANSAIFSITTDNYPEETTWDIRDGSGNIIASGGPYNGQSNSTFTQSFSTT